jgi:uncharacterized protein (TIGR02145 family)
MKIIVIISICGVILIGFSSCKKDKVELPSIATLAVANVTSNMATSGGTISNDGGALVIQRGVVWSTSPNPTITNNLTIDGSGKGSFKSNLTSLSINTTYYLRAYAINSSGTAYGNQQIFTATYQASQHICGGANVHNPNLIYGNMTDQEGNQYKTIIIGNQEWMAENLKTSIYRNGDPISTNLSDAEWFNTTNTQLGAWAFPNNDSLFECPYGKLYNWYAVSDSRHVCPSGWHEPTNDEWTDLTNYLGGITLAGGKMKTTGLQYWNTPNSEATNESGFSGLPSDSRNVNGTFSGIGSFGLWWSSTDYVPNFAWLRNLEYNSGNVTNLFGYNKQAGFSVRCLKD